MSQEDLMPAIKLFEHRVEDAERTVNELLGALNLLRKEAGLPPRPPGSGTSADATQSGAMEIKSDTFFAKKQQTAVREYLEMRRAFGQEGPAKPREIYDALISGGFESGAKDQETALVSLRAMLRKRSAVFVKVGESGAYGLAAWYPELKRTKEAKPDDDDAPERQDDGAEEAADVGDDVVEDDGEVDTAPTTVEAFNPAVA